jgi:hypothetical protein
MTEVVHVLSAPRQSAATGTYSDRLKVCSSCSSGRKPTTPWGCAPGLKNAMTGMLRMLKACDHLARSAPGGPEVDHDRALGLEHELLEIRVRRDLDLRHSGTFPFLVRCP